MRCTAMMLAVALLAACGGGPELEVRTYPLDHLSPADAEMLLTPYVRSEGGAIFRASEESPAITLRETPERLAQMEAILERHDRAPYTVELEFEVLEAGSFQGGSSEPGIDTLLRDVLRYESYRTAARAIVRVGPGHEVSQGLESGYILSAEVGRITPREVQLSIVFWIDEGVPVLTTGVTVPIGQTVVLGTAQGRSPGEATILTVRPTLIDEPAPARPAE